MGVLNFGNEFANSISYQSRDVVATFRCGGVRKSVLNLVGYISCKKYFVRSRKHVLNDGMIDCKTSETFFLT